MTFRILFVGMAALICFSGAAMGSPQRIVSTNLCADQYLIALADKSQIAGLTLYARDPLLSFYYERARGYPIVPSTAEAILPLKPDLIVGNPMRRLQTRALLKHFGFPILDIGTDQNFADIVAHTRLIAAAIGHPERGEALIAAMRAALERIPEHSGGWVPVAVHYQRQGFVTGPGTLMDEMMRRAGLRNLASQFGNAQLARLDLESVVEAQPDYILFTNDRRDIRDWGVALLAHPVFRVLRSKYVYIPDRLTVCGGPSFPYAVAALARAVHGRMARNER
ncbi:MAG TPA: ABC transporter substrate-binding protein [Rhizomicrobium sp.]|nr:ABC transporter substrate-binding protein [Rhizomicrobium sp.]